MKSAPKKMMPPETSPMALLSSIERERIRRTARGRPRARASVVRRVTAVEMPQVANVAPSA